MHLLSIQQQSLLSRASYSHEAAPTANLEPAAAVWGYQGLINPAITSMRTQALCSASQVGNSPEEVQALLSSGCFFHQHNAESESGTESFWVPWQPPFPPLTALPQPVTHCPAGSMVVVPGKEWSQITFHLLGSL